MASTFAEQVSGNIRAELARRKLNTETIVQALGIKTSAARNRLNGETEFSFDEVQAISKTTGIPIETLLHFEDEGETSQPLAA